MQVYRTIENKNKARHKMRIQLDRSFFIPKDATIIKETPDTIVYGYSIMSGKVGGVAFKGRAQKPSWHYSFRTEQDRQSYIDRWYKNIDQINAYKSEHKEAKQKAISEASVKAGEYYVTSWGYDQTNIDYIVVASVSPSGKTAYCKMADAIDLGESGQQDVLMPGTAYGDMFPMKVSGKDTLTGSYPYCKGSMKLGYFQKTNIGEVRYQTNPIFGH